ncbi:DUF2726 domain-containing protein [Aquisalimonas sp. 2447]|uniref:DUF2726 domain-containing protein n=1 Tax=Aquisalimonas sp. 2447 TaxID=2740807 RepID=UPI0014323D05|nr:DUF2726 domain-containing protein [Aquisalimonas sp. 2447]QIT56672.1 DUF2726 domain-containing protein [Aquisalimonas sp. 2447]
MDFAILLPATVTVLLVLLAFFVWVSRRRQRTPAISVRPRPVLTGAHRRLYETLQAGLPNHRVLARVPFSAFLEPRGKPPLVLGDQIADFLVCDSQLRVVAVAELTDGRQHSERDVLLRDAALPLVRWTADALPVASEVRETIRDLESLRAMSEHVDDDSADHGAGDPPDTAPMQGDRREPRL